MPGMCRELWNKIYKKDILIEVFDKIDKRIFWGEDALLVYSYCMNIKSIYVSKFCFYHHCYNKNSICNSVNEGFFENSYRLYSGLNKLFSGLPIESLLKRQVKWMMIDLNIVCMKALYGINGEILHRWNAMIDEKMFSDNYILYGKGAIGNDLFNILCKKGLTENMLGWADKKNNAEHLSRNKKEILVKEINNYEYKYVYVAVKDEKLYNEIRNELISNGVVPEKVVWIYGFEINLREGLNEIAVFSVE